MRSNNKTKISKNGILYKRLSMALTIFLSVIIAISCNPVQAFSHENRAIILSCDSRIGTPPKIRTVRIDIS